MNKKHLSLALLIIGSATAATWYLNQAEPVPVLIQAAETGEVELTVANTRAGTVKACRRARLSPGIGGQISTLGVREGERVKTGTLLLELWNRDLMAEIELNEAEANAATASARAACLQSQVTQRDAERLSRLRLTGAVSEEALDQAVTESKASIADCESAEARARISLSRIKVIEARLERTRLIAPFDGVVAEINGELNEYTTPSPPGIATPPAIDLIDSSCFYVAAPIDEVDAPRIEVGQSARVNLDAFDRQRFPGTVRRISDYVLDKEKQARTVVVEVEFSNPDDIRKLLAGYSADVEIILDVRESTLRVPTEAVLEGDHVLILNASDAVLEKRKIEIGISNWDHTEVLSGLSRGELIVTSVDRDGVEDGAFATQVSEE
ncbi:MAG: efflux RND transporter periplasmic adaptor subunit [Gammaproteobacteria bacterium]|nr:efflux RND transporter periplasmic adaptor subunit [Gammaproteobacteria bacterium]